MDPAGGKFHDLRSFEFNRLSVDIVKESKPTTKKYRDDVDVQLINESRP
jgi:hypothetical protein